ncbi:putative fibrinogen-like protein 1 [Apostichopus japonicus]|uniref:Putative fibrinogen-like protein 1 n=1 Tax=Stichopus japonicus TaxID=307972 RepID=A0A2G8LE83_STIJA|nr:putative fibrinogen-like protein 1 [Apostichopus japonicus]
MYYLKVRQCKNLRNQLLQSLLNHKARLQVRQCKNQMNITTAVTTEPQGTTLSKTVQESGEATTAVTTEPQGTTLGKFVQESEEPTTAVATEPQGTTLGKTVQESKKPTTAVTSEPQGTTLGKTVQESEEPTTAVTTEPQGTTLGKTVQESKEPTTAVTTEPQGTTLGSSIYTCPPNMIYGNCTCEATCEDPKGESACNSTCLGSTGCICKAGLMLNGMTVSVRVDAAVSLQRPTWLYRDCQDVYDAGHTQDGVYTIMPTGWPGLPFNVSCKMENGGGWTVFQRRTDGSTSFYQNWTAYKDGFGDSRNLWLGNEKLHYLTNQRNYKLRFDITTSSGSLNMLIYEFQVESESSNYTMNKLGTTVEYRGIQFSTYDRDNDACGNFNCAEKHKSGWWHSDERCSRCYSYSQCYRFQYSSNCKSICTSDNLNGVYNGGNGEMIYSRYNDYCNVQYVEMKIRPTY